MKQIKLDVDNICFCLCTFYNNGKANVMLIDSVWTDEKYRHQGYGNKLMKKVIELARKEGVDAIELVVNKDNAPAKKLYESVGMELTNKDCYRLILNKWKI